MHEYTPGTPLAAMPATKGELHFSPASKVFLGPRQALPCCNANGTRAATPMEHNSVTNRSPERFIINRAIRGGPVFLT